MNIHWIVTVKDILHFEAGLAAVTPVTRVAACALIENPRAGRRPIASTFWFHGARIWESPAWSGNVWSYYLIQRGPMERLYRRGRRRY